MAKAKKNKVTCSANFCREQLAPVSKFDRRSFRTKVLPRGRRLVLGCPVGKWQPRKARCTIPMQAQAMLRPRSKRSKR